MKRLALATVLLLGEGPVAFTQGGFIVEFDSVQVDAAVGHSIREKEWGYLIVGGQLAEDGSGWTYGMNYRLDALGQLIDRAEWDTGADHSYFAGMIDPIVDLPDGGHQACVNQHGGDLGVMFRYRLDGNGVLTGRDTILHLDPADSILVGMRHARGTTDGGMIVAGWRYVETGPAKALLLKVDSLAHVEWFQEFAYNQEVEMQGWGVAQYIDGGYLLTGIGLGNGNPNTSFLLRTDSLGNQLWRKYYGGRSNGTSVVRADTSGSIYTWSDYKDPSWSVASEWYQVLLRKWSPQGGLVWETRSHYGLWTHARDIEILPGGNLIACGSQVNAGFIAKYSAQGDSLWSRSLEVFAQYAYHNLYDVQPTSDGGFALTGYVLQDMYDPHPGLQTLWAIKTDSLGCVVPGCQNVGVQEYTIDLQEHLVVSPNPGSDVVNMRLELPEGGEVQGQAQVQLLDENGRLVLEQNVQQNLNQLSATLNVSALPAGMYYLHLRDARRWLAGRKVIVQ